MTTTPFPTARADARPGSLPHRANATMLTYLTDQSMVANLKATSKKQALQELAKRAAAITGLDERGIFNILLERERLGSTGVGRGIAIPHGKVPSLQHVVGLMAKLDRPIDFDSIDDEPVDLVFLLLWLMEQYWN